MSFLSGILDKLNPFSDNVDHEAIVAAEAKLAAELREKELTERGIAVVFRCHGPYPRHPDQAICDHWLQNNRTHCSKWDQSTCEHDHPPEDAAQNIEMRSQTLFFLPEEDIRAVAFQTLKGKGRDKVSVVRGQIGHDIDAESEVIEGGSFEENKVAYRDVFDIQVPPALIILMHVYYSMCISNQGR